MPPERSFYSRPTPKKALRSFFFVPIAAILGVAALRNPSAHTVGVFAASALLAFAGLWIVWRKGLPCQGPALVANAEGLRFWPWRRDSVFMPWEDLASIGSDPSDHSLIFHAKNAAAYERPHLIWLRRPPFVPQDVRTPAGEYFLNVAHEYWEGMR
jgi:hypothetical protein